MSKKRVFISFDYDHDEVLKVYLVGQAKNPDSPFELTDWSNKEHLTGNWQEKARTRIKGVDVVAVLCGQHTDRASGVAAELKIAQEEKIPYFLLNGYRDATGKKPTTAKDTDLIYKWTWDNLKALINGGR